ncbi:MAG TPA: NAD(P)-dependent oxidoreductase [Casimicrobiaceae bacterium]|nr:NAD(P)-dependent oxidoreductase [Casimicrobiaceae bacterium]
MQRIASNVLVTGSAGFIGLPVVEQFSQRGAQVVALDLVAPERTVDGVETITGDYRDASGLKTLIEKHRIDTIVHAGGISGPMLARDTPMLVCEANVIGTIRLLEAARAGKVQRFVYCSSAMAFGNTPPAPVPDNAPLEAHDLYGASKGASDLLLRAYRAQYGLDAVSLRISNAYGPRRRTRCAIKTMIENALDGVPTDMTWGLGYGRAYLYIDDAVAAIIAAACAERLPQWAYNIAGAQFAMMEEIAAIVRELVPGARITMQPGVDGLGYRREALDISAAARDLDWVPRFSIEQGIAAYLDWIVGQRRAQGTAAAKEAT